MSLSIPPTLNSGDVRNVNLLEVVSLPCLCQPTAVNLPGHSDISEQQGCWVLGNGKVLFSQASSWRTPLETCSNIPFPLRCSFDYGHTFVSIDDLSASVLNPAPGKLWNETWVISSPSHTVWWPESQISFSVAYMKVCFLRGLKTNSPDSTVRRIKPYLTQPQTKTLKYIPMTLKMTAQDQVNWHWKFIHFRNIYIYIKKEINTKFYIFANTVLHR